MIKTEPVTSAYQLAVNNVARAIRKQSSRPTGELESFIDAFTASTYLRIAFCKASVQEVCDDIVHAKV